MSQPPNHPEHDPQWDPQSSPADQSANPAGQPGPGAGVPDGHSHQAPGNTGVEGQSYSMPVGPDGQPDSGPVGPDGQPYNGPVGPDGQPQQGYSNAAPDKPKSNPFAIKKLLSALLVLILLGVGAYFIWNNQQKSAALTVGNCIVSSGEQDNLDVKVVDCSDDSIYSEYVGEVLDAAGTCTDPGAYQYALASEDAGAKDATKVGCVIPQLFEGKCYSVVEDSVNELNLVDCGNADFKVNKATDQSGAECAADKQVVDFTVPARTYCIGQP